MEEQFPVPWNTVASKIGNGVISLPRQLRCHCNPDHNKVSSLSNTTVVLIFPNLCLWRRSLRSNVRGIHSKKLYRATLRSLKLLIVNTHNCLKLQISVSATYSRNDSSSLLALAVIRWFLNAWKINKQTKKQQKQKLKKGSIQIDHPAIYFGIAV